MCLGTYRDRVMYIQASDSGQTPSEPEFDSCRHLTTLPSFFFFKKAASFNTGTDFNKSVLISAKCVTVTAITLTMRG